MFYQKVAKYCKDNNISICEFEKMCGLGNGAVSKWKDEKSNPSVATLMKIAAATKISVGTWMK